MGFEWTPELSVGVETIDAQHQELFRRVNALLVAIGGGREEHELLDTLAFLGDYVITHFDDEERLMRETGYPGLAGQLTEHAQLMGAFKRLRAQFARHGVDSMLAKEVESQLCEWLVRHLQRTDRALGEWLAQRPRT